MTVIPEILKTKTATQLHGLFVEAETLRETGILPVESELRMIAQIVFDKNDLNHLMHVSNEVYRQLAIDAIAYWKRNGYPS